MPSSRRGAKHRQGHRSATSGRRKYAESSPPTGGWISAIPPEILSYIFEIGLHLSDDLNHRLSFPNTVAQVSRSWRETAIETSSLWTTLTVPKFSPTWLERSKQQPLDLSLDFSDMTDTEAQPIMDAILPHVQRWRLFSLHDPETWQIIERLEDFAAPLLECLWISTNDIWDKPGGLDLFRDAPRSQELRMCGVSLENCRPPVGSVKTFHFRVTAWQEWYSFHHFRSMFMDFASLTTLVLQGTVVDVEAEDAESDGWHVDLPLLTTLVVECRTCLDDYVVALLEALNVPNLHTLVLHLSDDTEEDSEKEWYSDLKGLAALSPKFGALQTLHLQSKMSQAFVRPFMKAFPNITTLILGHMTREFFIMMHVVGSLSDESWRRLRTLTIGAIHYPAHSKDGRFIEDVVSFVKSARKGRRSPVDTVRVGSGIVCQGRPAVRSIRAQLSGAGVTVEEIPEDLDIQYQRLMKEGEFCEVEDVDDESGSGDTDEGALVDLD